jgi:hypothetical protein
MTDDYVVKFVAMDDLPPKVRECRLASRQRDREHKDACPDCLESEAQTMLFDATSHRADGREATALELEVEAAELRSRAANIRSNFRKRKHD